MDALLQLIHHHQPDPLRSAHLDGSASLVKLESAPTTIRMLQTMVPVDPRALRFQRRMEKKKNKQNKINRDVKKKKKQQQAEKSKATSTAETQQ